MTTKSNPARAVEHASAQRDGRELAKKYETDTLRAVNHFGYLRRSEIASAVWPGPSSRSAYVMASRTVRRLLAKGLLLERPDALGGKAVVLSAEGARHLRADGEAARDGYDLAVGGPQFFHRTLGTCYLIQQTLKGHAVYGEHAFSTRRAPIDKSYLAKSKDFEKIPDGLVVRNGREDELRAGLMAVDWVEVESVYKPYDEIRRIFLLSHMVGRLVDRDEGSLVLQQVIFVVDQRASHHKRISAYVGRFLKELPREAHAYLLDHYKVALCDVRVPLVWRGCRVLTMRELKHELDKTPRTQEKFHEDVPPDDVEEDAVAPSDEVKQELETPSLRGH